ncbi:MAG: RTX family of calcium-binding protein, partial [Candidatus Yanofskybacteria bacterium GW2011_GWC2_37_9]
ITLPTNSVSLTGAATDDGLPAGSTLTVTWSRVSGAGTVTFSNANALTTTATFSSAGTYVLRLSVSDSALTASDDVTVTVNSAPTPGTYISNNAWQNVSFARQTGSFTASFDITPSGNAIDGVTGLASASVFGYTGLAAIVRFADTGIIDARNGSVYAALNTLRYSAGTSYYFDITVNLSTRAYSVMVTPQGGVAVQIANNFAFRTEQSSVTGLGYLAFLTSVGTHTISNFTIGDAPPPSNQPPILSAIGAKSVNENETLTFTVSATDANGDTLTYSASGLPSGATFNPNSRIFSFSPSYTQAGSYLVTFSVSDGKGGTDSEIVTVTVANTNRAPMANAGNNQTVTLPEGTTLSGISSSDPDGNTLTYAWTKVSGPASTIANPSAASTSVSFTTQGAYIFRLTVSDGILTSTDNVTIAVVPTPSGSTDSDNDGVVDASDKCGNTPSGKIVNAVGCPLPKVSRFTTKTDLTSVDLNAVSSFESGNIHGKVTWNQGNTSYVLIRSGNELDIDANLDITYGTVNLNSVALPELNKPATITLYNVSVANPQILRDGDLCSGCSTYSIVSAPPAISAVALTNITSSGATISWITDVVSDSRVDYGLTSAYGSQASLADSVISHSISLVNLTSNTTYHFTVLSKGTSATSGTTTDFTFTTSSTGGGGGGGGGGGKKPPVAPLGMVVGCDNRTTGFSVTTGQSCVSNRPITTPTSITGCDNRTTGFSVTTGQSCVGNIPTNSSNTSGPSAYNFGAVTLRNGSRGEAVKELQRFLNARLNLGLVVDGKLGPKTIAVIKQWQRDNGLAPDGLVGARTKARMNGE